MFGHALVPGWRPFVNKVYAPDMFYTCATASWFDGGVRVRDLARDIVLCSWARPFTLTVPLSTQVYKWVPANLMLGVTL